MVLHNFECSQGHITEKLVDTNEKDWQWKTCGEGDCFELAERVYLSKRAQAFHRLPITIYRNASGEVRFPGSASEPMPDNYKAQGFERVEMTFHEARRFQKQFNEQERGRDSIKKEFMDYMESQEKSESRSDLLHAMRSMSPIGREYAEHVIRESEKRRDYLSHDPGFRIEILED